MFFVRPRRHSFIGERRLVLQSSGFSVASSVMSLTYRRFRQALYLPILKGLRVKFKGKTIRAKRVLWRQYKFKVGLTHMSIRGLAFSALCRMRAKQRMVLWSYSRRSLLLTVEAFKSLKPINLYHARGIRAKRQKRFWKAGKVSAYR